MTKTLKKPADYPDLSFRIDAALNQSIQHRTVAGTSRHQVAKRDLERYYDTLAAERRTLAGLFALNELLSLCDMANGTQFNNHHQLAIEVSDFVTFGGHKQWGVDAAALVDTVQALTPGQVWALVDGLERYWSSGATPDAEGLMGVGLVPAEGIDVL